VFDQALQSRLAPAIGWLAVRLVRRGVQADTLTWAGFAVGLLAALAIALQAWLAGLCLLLLSRLLDGLDGAVARLTRPTDRGSFLDITLDLVFYASIPLAFALADPAAHALAAAVLLASFIGTGSSFLAFAVLAEKRGLPTTGPLRKGFYFLGGLTEAGETLVVFVAMCLWPEHFTPLALGFAALCLLTLLTRLHAGCTTLGDAGERR
jgi:phosphatidylglycerophosphate synthase